MKNVRTYFGIIVLCFFISGCSLFNGSDNDETERTYPEAMSYELLSIQNIKNKLTPPDSVNAEVYVNAVIKCPEGVTCFLPDGIVISDSLQTDPLTEGIHLYVENPLQFEEEERYRMSLDVGTYPGNGKKRYQLLGFTLLQKYD